MKPLRKNINEWTDELKIKFYSTSLRRFEINDLHLRKITAAEFIRMLRTSQFNYENRNLFNKKLIAFSKKYNIKKEYISKLLELRKDDYVKFKVDNKVHIGRYQGELNNGKELLEIEINGNGALNFLYIEKDKIHFPTRKEISRALKKEIESKSGREIIPLPENLTNKFPFSSYYD